MQSRSARQHDRAGEDAPLVDEVRQPVGVLFLLEFEAGPVAFFLEELEDACPQPLQEVRAHAGLEDQISVLVELPPFLLGHECHRLPWMGAISTARERRDRPWESPSCSA